MTPQETQTHNTFKCVTGCGRYVSDRAVLARIIYEYSWARTALTTDPPDEELGSYSNVRDRLERELRLIRCDACSARLISTMPTADAESARRWEAEQMRLVSLLGEPKAVVCDPESESSSATQQEGQ